MASSVGTVPKRLAFKHGDRTVYEWEQGYEEINVYIQPPSGITAKDLACKISVGHLLLGIKGNPPYLDVRSTMPYAHGWLCGRLRQASFDCAGCYLLLDGTAG